MTGFLVAAVIVVAALVGGCCAGIVWPGHHGKTQPDDRR